ncbi:MAG TPA: glycosyltransferase [Syntrophomonadaceae bacterium]|nr:glycosyltransferase [Syntrophomonadaceae bacterium]
MRVFFSNTAPLIKYGIGQAFADLGNEVCFCNVLSDRDWTGTLEAFQPDYVFTDGGWGVYDQLFPYLKDRAIPHIYWAIEDPPFWQTLSLPFARQSEYVFTTCQESIKRYEEQGIRAHFLPFAYHPACYHPVAPDSRFAYDIVFMGNNYDYFPERIEAARKILQPLMDRDYNIKIFGNEWWLDSGRPFFIKPEFYGGYLASEDLGAVCASVPIVIGLHSVVNSRTMLSMRTFEVLGCAGFHLTQWTPAVEHYFINRTHLVWTQSRRETLDLVDYYLSHPEERHKIAFGGRQEVWEKHTYYHRINTILEVLGSRAQAQRPGVIQQQRAVSFRVNNRRVAIDKRK